MLQHEIERKLGEKADKWELHGLQTENRELKNQVNELERKIGYLESTNSNTKNTFQMLFDIMIEHPQFSDLENEIHQLKNSIWY
jgi:hypothetical protein